LPPRAGDAILSRLSTRRDELIVRDVGAETIVYDLRTNCAHCLGRTAGAVWRTWDGRSGLSETARRGSQALGEPLDEASVRLVLRRLYQAGLIERPAWDSDSSHKTRRALGRRVALRGVGVAAGLAVLSIAAVSRAGGGYVLIERPTLFAQFPVL
jgi:hypothetical protein